MSEKSKLPELLCPAGSPDALDAAIEGGADAVYLGGSDMNARLHAGNFSPEQLRDAVRRAHAFGVKVYLTLNTLVTDRELPAFLDAAREASRTGVDALIVADIGGAALIHRAIPGMELHASTQMSGHNSLMGAELQRLGFSRMVAARELSAENLRLLTSESPIETEVFVHGALCVSHSGQCLFSSLVGGRSGNRGVCAQPCRLPYGCGTCGTENRDAANPSNAKNGGMIYGRTRGKAKDAEYSDMWSGAKDAGYGGMRSGAGDVGCGGARSSAGAGRTYNSERSGANREYGDIRSVAQNAYGNERRREHACSGTHSRARNAMCGKERNGMGGNTASDVWDGVGYPLSLKDLSLAAHVPELIGMGVASFKIEGRMKSPEYVRDTARIWRRLLDEQRGATQQELQTLAACFSRSGFTDGYYTGRTGRGMLGVRRESDKRASRSTEPFAGLQRRVALDLRAVLHAGEPACLTLSDGRHTVSVTGDCPDRALTAPMSAQQVLRSLSRFGGTVYRVKDAQAEVGEGLMMPVSRLNDLRRRGLEALEAACALPAREEREVVFSALPLGERSSCNTARFRSAEQVTPEAVAFFDRISLPLECFARQGQENGQPDGINAQGWGRSDAANSKILSENRMSQPDGEREVHFPGNILPMDRSEGLTDRTEAATGKSEAVTDKSEAVTDELGAVMSGSGTVIGGLEAVTGGAETVTSGVEALSRIFGWRGLTHADGRCPACGVVLPPVIFDRELPVVRRMLADAKAAGVRYAVVGNLGHLAPVREAGLIPVGDFRLNVTNCESAALYFSMGFEELLLSPELTLPQMRDIGGNTAALVYGRVPLMTLEKCVIRELAGCDACRSGTVRMIDRRGVSFPVLREWEHRNVIYNSLPTGMTDRGEGLDRYGLSNRHYLFSIESREDVNAVIGAADANRSLPFPVRRIPT